MYKYIVFLIILYAVLTPVIICQNLESPCPTLFQYKYDKHVGLYGEISIIVEPTNFLQINLQMSIGNAVTDNGKLELARPKEAATMVMNRRPLLYYLFFPAWSGIPPKVTQILVNGNLVCSGPKIPMNLVSVITTVNLQHTLRINILPSSSNLPPDNNFIHIPPRQDFNQPTEELDERYDYTNRPPKPADDKNRFNFNPTPPPPNRFNFNPQSANPADVYKGNPFFNNAQTLPPVASAKPTETETETVPDRFVFGEDFDLVSKNSEQSVRPFENVCGQSLNANHLIFNGQVVSRGAFPWLVALFVVKDNGPSYICSGSLISNRHVVTAAHCVLVNHRKTRPSELLLILGKLNLKKWIPLPGEKIVEPSAIHIHPDYESHNGDADIAVLVLSEPIQFSKYIRPICLWRGDTDLNKVVGQSGTVVGWGKDESGVLMTEEPKQIDLPIVSQEKCLASNHQFHFSTSNRTLCAGARNGSGPCNGDSGGGLLIKVDGKWMLRGIVSLSISDSSVKGCDLSNYIVFCDATKFTNWLLSFLK